MSVSYSAYAVLGVRLPMSVWLKERKVKAFEHTYPETYVYDPSTGKLLWRKEMVPAVPEIEEWGVYSCPQVGVGAVTWVRYSHDDCSFAYVGLVALADSTTGGEMHKVGVEQIKYVRSRIMTCLEKAGLWKEEMFGVWPLLHVSY